MIREAKRSEVEEEIRRQVDVLMREELDLLKIVSNSYMQDQNDNHNENVHEKVLRRYLAWIYLIFLGSRKGQR